MATQLLGDADSAEQAAGDGTPTIVVIELADPANILKDQSLFEREDGTPGTVPLPEADPANILTDLSLSEHETGHAVPETVETVILAAHARIVEKATGVRPRPLARPPRHPYVSFVLADSEATALRWAAQIQTEIHKELSAETDPDKRRRGPRLQCGIALVHRSPRTVRQRLARLSVVRLAEPLIDRILGEASQEPEIEWPWIRGYTEIDRILDQGVAGRIVCSPDVYDALRKDEIYDYYRWQIAKPPPARRESTIPQPWRTLYEWSQLKRAREIETGLKTTLSDLIRPSAPWECLYDDDQVLLNTPFERVFSEEIRQWVEPSRRVRGKRSKIQFSKIQFPERPRSDNDLVGLALSGGGMRSGVFSMGVMQALAYNDFLADVDYISTVSGGGYVGSAVSALAAEELPYVGLNWLGTRKDNFPLTSPRPDGDSSRSWSQVHGNESPAVKHVRENAALYGTKLGLFDAKTWIIAGRYLTSTAVLWGFFLLPIVTLVGLAGIVLHDLMGQASPDTKVVFRDVSILLGLLAAALLLLSLEPTSEFVRRRPPLWWYGSVPLVLTLGAAGWAVRSFTTVPDLDQVWRDWEVLIIVLGSLLIYFALLWVLLYEELIKGFVHKAIRFSTYGVGVAAAALVAVLLFGSVTTVSHHDQLWKDLHVLLAVLSPLLIFGASAALSNFTDEPAPKLVQDIALRVTQVLPVGAGILAMMLLASAGVWGFDWLAGGSKSYENIARVAVGATAAGGALTTVVSLNKLWGMKLTQAVAWRALLGFGGYVVLGVLVIVWYGILWREYHQGTSATWLWIGAGLSAGLVTLTIIHSFGRGVLNNLSLNRIYAAMLAKTWVIAARPEKQEGAKGLARWTRVWSRDDIRMSNLRLNAAPAPQTEDRPTGPYHLICTTLNLPGSTSTKLLDRNADSFVIAPLHSGSALTRWVETKDHDDLKDLRLSQAAAISGAAISPNAGEHTSRTFSILTTLLNIRLGRWIDNPRPSQIPIPWKWLADTPLVLYWKEMLGLASHNDGQIYLSDGGHFENLGLYELFRRRCKYIIAVTADAGPLSEQFDLSNIGQALRLARVDFGVEARFEKFTPLLHDPKTGYVQTYFAAAELEYPANGKGELANGKGETDGGVLILIKTGLQEDDLPLDIAEYRLGDNPAFPYDSTFDQQYDQPIFESYRQLGYVAASAMCRNAGKPDDPPQERFKKVLEAPIPPPGGSPSPTLIGGTVNGNPDPATISDVTSGASSAARASAVEPKKDISRNRRARTKPRIE